MDKEPKPNPEIPVCPIAETCQHSATCKFLSNCVLAEQRHWQTVNPQCCA